MIDRRLFLALALMVLAIIVWAWVDGGREPIHQISTPIPVPEGVR